MSPSSICRTLIAASVSFFLITATAQAVHVKAYHKKDGTYVAAHNRKAPSHHSTSSHKHKK